MRLGVDGLNSGLELIGRCFDAMMPSGRLCVAERETVLSRRDKVAELIPKEVWNV